MRPKTSLFYGILVIAAGILLIVFNGRAQLLSWVVILAGISLAVPCLCSLVSAISSNRQARRDGTGSMSLSILNSGVVIASLIGIGAGVWMIVHPAFFIGFLAYAFAVIIILYGVYQILEIAWIYRPQPAGLYVVPILMIVAGLVILFSSVRAIQSTVVLITGISLVCAGVNAILEFALSKD